MKYKIVYNDCYGGYTLSYKAIDWLSEQRSQWYFIDEYDGRETVVTPADLSWEVIDEYDDTDYEYYEWDFKNHCVKKY